jgi:hypothetical protein
MIKEIYLSVIRVELVKTFLDDVIAVEILGKENNIGFQRLPDKFNLQS